MEDSPKQTVMESISEQQQIEIKTKTSAAASPEPNTRARKQRGIFTTSNSMPPMRVNYPNGPWPVQNSHLPGLESGDNAQVDNIRDQYLRRDPIAITPTEPIEMPAASIESNSNNGSQSSILDAGLQNGQLQQRCIENENDPDEPSIVDDVDSLIGNYQVNPLDGSLMKIIPIQPIDGPFPEDLDIGIKSNIHGNFDNNAAQSEQPCRRKYRKRKFRETYDDDEYLPSNLKQTGGIPKPTGNKAEEVLKAAKSLFSKRTRTLYHWLYPSTSKLELKNIVVSAWDTLQESEKHFYISQVLGRFGFPASNLMVNPQIGGLQGMPTDHLRGTLTSLVVASGCSGTTPVASCSGESSSQDDATKRVVEELLANNDSLDSEWNVSSKSNRSPGEKRKKRKYSHLKSSPETDNDENGSEFVLGLHGIDEEINHSKLDDEDFQNDPELSKEIATFKLNTGQKAGEFQNEQIM